MGSDGSESESARAQLEAVMALVRTAPSPIALAEVETGVTLEISDPMLEIARATRDEVVGRTSIELGWISPEDRAKLVEELRTRGFTSPRRIDDSEAGGPGGRTVGYAARTIMIAGNLYLLGTCEDITERDEAEAELEAAEKRFRALVEKIPAITFTEPWHERLGVQPATYISPQIEAILGSPPEEWYEHPGRWESMFHPDDTDRIMARYEEANRTGVFSEEYRMIRPDGSVVWLHEASSLLRKDDGSPDQWLGVVFDITERREEEEQARLTSERLGALYDVSRTLLEARSLEETADRALAWMVTSTGAISAGVVLLEEGGSTFNVVASYNPRSDLPVGVSIPLPPLDLGSLRSEGTVILDDIFSDERAAADPTMASLRSTGARSIALLPLRAGDKPLGLVALTHDTPGYFTSENLAMAREVADQLSIALQQAELRRRADRYASELEETVTRLRNIDRERRHLLERVVRAQEEERRHIASDIHDDSIQKMAAVGLRLDVLRHHLDDPTRLEEIDQLSDVVDMTIGRLRRLMFELWPPDLERYGLAAAIRADLIGQRDEFGIEFKLRDDMTVTLPIEERIIAYRIVQEALSNVRRHSEASSVDVTLTSTDGEIHVTISDDGKGLPEDIVGSPPGHMGLTAMRERAQLAGGWLEFKPRRPRGTRIEFAIPLGGDTEEDASPSP